MNGHWNVNQSESLDHEYREVRAAALASLALESDPDRRAAAAALLRHIAGRQLIPTAERLPDLPWWRDAPAKHSPSLRQSPA